MVILFVIAALLACLAFGVYNLKWHFLISGYNTLPAEEKQKVDINGVSKQTSLLLYSVAVVLVCMGVALWQELDWLMIPLILAIIVCSIFFSLRSQRYMNGASFSMRGQKIAPIIIVVVLIGSAVLLYFSTQPSTIEATDDGLTINGMYGDSFTFAQMSDVTLVDELPAISMRTNGSAVGSKLKGHFKFENGDKAVLFVDKSKPPFVTFTANDKLYYVNLENAADTEALYAALQP